MDEVTKEELSQMIADLSLTDNWPARDRLCVALIELRAIREQMSPAPIMEWLRKWRGVRS